MSTERLHVISTRMNCRMLAQKLVSVRRGFALLKCKSDALQVRLRETEELISIKEREVEKMFGEAFKALSKTELHGGQLEIFTKLSQVPSPTLTCDIEQVFGVEVVKLKIERQGTDAEILWKCGHLLVETKRVFDVLVEGFVELAGMQNQLKTIQAQLEATNKRKNSLEHNVIPKTENTVCYIQGELDEMEREEFFKLKKILEIKEGTQNKQ